MSSRQILQIEPWVPVLATTNSCPIAVPIRMNLGVYPCHVKGAKGTETCPSRCFTRIQGQLESMDRIDSCFPRRWSGPLPKVSGWCKAGRRQECAGGTPSGCATS